MSLHKLAEVTIKVYGLPEHCSTNDALQELTDEAEALIESIVYKGRLNVLLANTYSELADKIIIDVKGA